VAISAARSESVRGVTTPVEIAAIAWRLVEPHSARRCHDSTPSLRPWPARSAVRLRGRRESSGPLACTPRSMDRQATNGCRPRAR
jgi:hypothetical protein